MYCSVCGISVDPPRQPKRKAWIEIRAAVLDRDRVCRCDGEGCNHDDPCTRPPEHVDHLVPRRAGGSDDLSNLAGMCAPCHRRKSRGIEKKKFPILCGDCKA